MSNLDRSKGNILSTSTVSMLNKFGEALSLFLFAGRLAGPIVKSESIWSNSTSSGLAASFWLSSELLGVAGDFFPFLGYFFCI